MGSTSPASLITKKVFPRGGGRKRRGRTKKLRISRRASKRGKGKDSLGRERRPRGDGLLREKYKRRGKRYSFGGGAKGDDLHPSMSPVVLRSDKLETEGLWEV